MHAVGLHIGRSAETLAHYGASLKAECWRFLILLHALIQSACCPVQVEPPASPAKQRGGQDGAHWLFFELLWRDFFRFVTKKYTQLNDSAAAADQLAATTQPALAHAMA